MFNVTESAAAAMAQKLADDPDEVVIRLSLKGNRVIRIGGTGFTFFKGLTYIEYEPR